MAAAGAQALGAAASTTVLGPVVQLSRRRRSGRHHRPSLLPNFHSLSDTWSLGIVDDPSSAVHSTRQSDPPPTNLLLKSTHTQTASFNIDGGDSSSLHDRSPRLVSQDGHQHQYNKSSTEGSASAGGRRGDRSCRLAMVAASAIAGASSATAAAAAIVFPARADEVLAAIPLESGFPAISLPSQTDFPAISLPTDILGVDPAIIAGGAIALAIPAVVVALLSRPAAKEVTPEEAFKVLSDVEGSVLLDVREKAVIDVDGSPSLTKLKKKKVAMVAFEIEDEGTVVEDPEFESKVAVKPGFEDKETATVVVIDRSGKIGKKAANTLAKTGYSRVLFVKGGAELWKTEGLPWKMPSKAPFKVDIEAIKEAIDNTVKENPSIVPTTLGVAAAAGASVVFLTEVETTMQVIGSLALVQLLVRKFLFAKDRKQTLEEIDALLSSRDEFVKGLQKFRTAVLTGEAGTEEGGLPKTLSSANNMPMTPLVEATPASSVTVELPIVSSEEAPVVSHADTTTSQMSNPSGGDAVGSISVATEATASEPAITTGDKTVANSTAVAGGLPIDSSKAEEVPSATSRPLSPYAIYPDLKPPTSPTPTKP